MKCHTGKGRLLSPLELMRLQANWNAMIPMIYSDALDRGDVETVGILRRMYGADDEPEPMDTASPIKETGSGT